MSNEKERLLKKKRKKSKSRDRSSKKTKSKVLKIENDKKEIKKPKWLPSLTKNILLFIALVVLAVFFFIGPAKTFMATFSSGTDTADLDPGLGLTLL